MITGGRIKHECIVFKRCVALVICRPSHFRLLASTSSRCVVLVICGIQRELHHSVPLLFPHVLPCVRPVASKELLCVTPSCALLSFVDQYVYFEALNHFYFFLLPSFFFVAVACACVCTCVHFHIICFLMLHKWPFLVQSKENAVLSL